MVNLETPNTRDDKVLIAHSTAYKVENPVLHLIVLGIFTALILTVIQMTDNTFAATAVDAT